MLMITLDGLLRTLAGDVPGLRQHRLQRRRVGPCLVRPHLSWAPACTLYRLLKERCGRVGIAVLAHIDELDHVI